MTSCESVSFTGTSLYRMTATAPSLTKPRVSDDVRGETRASSALRYENSNALHAGEVQSNMR